MLDLTEADGGCRLRLRVRPGGREDRLIGDYGGRLKVTVAAPPDRGKANAAVLRLLAAALDLPIARLRVVAGLTAHDKVVAIEGCLPAEVRARIDRALGASAPDDRAG